MSLQVRKYILLLSLLFDVYYLVVLRSFFSVVCVFSPVHTTQFATQFNYLIFFCTLLIKNLRLETEIDNQFEKEILNKV